MNITLVKTGPETKHANKGRTMSTKHESGVMTVICDVSFDFFCFRWIWNSGVQISARYILRKKCPWSELFWSLFSRIRTEYEEILCISPYSIRIGDDTDRNNSEYGHYSHSDIEAYSESCEASKMKDLIGLYTF